jgi:hypothetical protein
MSSLVLICLISAMAGTLLGWYFRGMLGWLIFFCVLLSLCLFAVAILYFGPRIQSYSLQYLAGYAIYEIAPYLIFILFPLVLFAALLRFVLSLLKREGTK